MNVWIEKFNHEAKIVSQKNPHCKKTYAFTQWLLVVSLSFLLTMTVCFIGFGTLYSFIHVVLFISHSLFVSLPNQDKLIVDPTAFDLQGSMKKSSEILFEV
jgi:hypothetical protein